MEEERQELKERFEDAFVAKETEDFFIAFSECLRFISDTPILNSRAKKILSSASPMSALGRVSKLHKELNKLWLDDYDAAKLLWSDMLKGIGGFPTQYRIPPQFTDHKLARAMAKIFYSGLLSTLLGSNERFGKVALILNKREAQICLAKNPAICYAVRNRQKNKRELPLRFSIIVALLREPTGMSVRRLCVVCGKADPTPDDLTNIKREIDGVNKNFKKKLGAENDLIVKRKNDNKNIYALNRESFHFR